MELFSVTRRSHGGENMANLHLCNSTQASIPSSCNGAPLLKSSSICPCLAFYLTVSCRVNGASFLILFQSTRGTISPNLHVVTLPEADQESLVKGIWAKSIPKWWRVVILVPFCPSMFSLRAYSDHEFQLLSPHLLTWHFSEARWGSEDESLSKYFLDVVIDLFLSALMLGKPIYSWTVCYSSFVRNSKNKH